MSNFVEELKSVKAKGSIVEVGLGVPLLNEITLFPGASEVFVYGECPYGKGTWDTNGLRSISSESTSHYAKILYDRIPDKNHFAMVTSGCHKNDGESHGWIAVCNATGSYGCHFRISDNSSRFSAIRSAGETQKWLLRNILSIDNSNWENSSDLLPENIRVDVLNGPGINKEVCLRFCKEDNPLVWSGGRMIRAVDHIRKNQHYFRGSFNPATNAHMAMSGMSTCEISVDNARKGEAELPDIAHRINMLELLNRSVMITRGCSRFVDFHKMLTNVGGKTYNGHYIVGADTFNAIIDDKFCPTEDYLECLKGSTFEVFRRNGECVNHELAEKRGISFFEVYDKRIWDISSTKSRSFGSDLSEVVVDYIKRHGLYENSNSW